MPARAAVVERGFSPDGHNAVEAAGGMVASAHTAATDAGAEVLADGGSAGDAAVATGFALTVCEPQGSGIGGQSLAVVRRGDVSVTVDGSSRVPSLTHLDRLGDGDRRLGHRATTVPSTPATFAWLHQRYGRLPWARVLEPAVRLAREGYPISALQHRLQADRVDEFAAVPNRSGARYFLDADGGPLSEGTTFRQPELATVLESLARRGVEDFYQGEIAHQIDADMRANDGFLRADDLALIPWPVERPPLRRRYRGLTLLTMPPPGAGRVLLHVMMILERLDPELLVSDDPRAAHFLAEALRKAFLQRRDRPYDANTYAQVPDKRLLSRAFAAEIAEGIADDVDPRLPLVDPVGADQAETTHFSVMDAAGDVVAVTQSVELVYGSKAAADGLGFLYNNYLMALETEDPAHPYYLRPNAVPWSSAAPTVVMRRGRPWLVLGTPGSERIFSALAQVLVRVIDGGWSLDDAIEAPRLHCSIGGTLSVEDGRLDEGSLARLADVGYTVKPLEARSFSLGCVQAVLRRAGGAGFQGMADPRRDGSASGP